MLVQLHVVSKFVLDLFVNHIVGFLLTRLKWPCPTEGGFSGLSYQELMKIALWTYCCLIDDHYPTKISDITINKEGKTCPFL